MFLALRCSVKWVYFYRKKKIAKIVIYDQARVKGGSNYKYPWATLGFEALLYTLVYFYIFCLRFIGLKTRLDTVLKRINDENPESIKIDLIRFFIIIQNNNDYINYYKKDETLTSNTTVYYCIIYP